MSGLKRGTSSSIFNITGFEKTMPQGKNWQELWKNNEYKDQLIEMTKLYVL